MPQPLQGTAWIMHGFYMDYYAWIMDGLCMDYYACSSLQE